MNDFTRSRGDAEGERVKPDLRDRNISWAVRDIRRARSVPCDDSAPPRLRVKPFLKWTGTALQLGGCLVLALHVPLSSYAYGAMSAGAGIWLALSLAGRDWPQAALMAGFEITNLIGIWRWVIG